MGYNAGLNIAGIGINPPIDDPTGIASLKGVNDNDFIQRKSGLWVNRSIAQVRADLNSQETISSNADFSLLVGTNAERILYTGAQSANRSVTLSSLNAGRGAKFHITHSGTGGFLLNIGTGPLKALRAGQWAEFIFDGTNWYLSNFGVLDVAPAMELVQTQVVSGSYYVDFTTGFATGFDDYIFEFAQVSSNGTAQLDIRFSENGGSSYVSSPYYDYSYYITQQVAGTSGYALSVTSATATSLMAIGQSIYNSPSYGVSGQFSLLRTSTYYTLMTGVYGGYVYGLTPITGKFYSGSNTPINGVRFSASGGSTPLYGTFRMFRVKTS